MAPAPVHEPEVIRDKAAMRAWSRRRRAEGKAVTLVPTMGFLHEGHLSLVSAAVAAASTGPVAVVVSIYVNPSQFAPTEDLATYPSDFAGDLRKLAATGLVAAPQCSAPRTSTSAEAPTAPPPPARCRAWRTPVGMRTTHGFVWSGWRRGCAGAAGPYSSATWPPWSPSCSTSSSRTSLCSGRRIISSGASSAGCNKLQLGKRVPKIHLAVVYHTKGTTAYMRAIGTSNIG